MLHGYCDSVVEMMVTKERGWYVKDGRDDTAADAEQGESGKKIPCDPNNRKQSYHLQAPSKAPSDGTSLKPYSF